MVCVTGTKPEPEKQVASLLLFTTRHVSHGKLPIFGHDTSRKCSFTEDGLVQNNLIN